MKKFTALIMSAMLALGIVSPVSAATYDWTNGYSSFLESQLKEVQDGESEYSRYALYDIGNDGVPELFLQNERLTNNYQVYYYDDGGLFMDRAFSATGFYEDEDGNFVVAYGNEVGATYVLFEADKSLAASKQLFRERRGNKNSDGTYEQVYLYGNKEVSEEEYNTLFDEQIINVGLTFHEITEKVIYDDMYIGTAYMDADKIPYVAGIRSNGTTKLLFSDSTSVLSEENGEELIDSLLMVNGQIIANIFPVNLDGTTYVPLRAVGTTLNASVSWVGDLNKINIDNGNTYIEMFIDERIAYIDGKMVELDASPQLIDGSTYVPVRFVSEALNAAANFIDGDEGFLPIVAIESNKPLEVSPLTEKEAYDKVNILFENLDWSTSGSVFLRSYMDSVILIEGGELVGGRYLEFTVDVNKTQKIWVDQYTGYVFSKYSANSGFGIGPGVDGVMDALLEMYR